MNFELIIIDTNKIELHSQPKAWMSKELMFEWISNVIEPYCRSFDRSLLILDRFKVHAMPEVVKKLNDLNIDVVFIPAGLTFILQPLDVYINKPLKDAMKDEFEKFMQKDELELTKKGLKFSYLLTSNLVIRKIKETNKTDRG